MKTANLTVRIDPILKRQASDAARLLDLSLSQVVTAAFKGLLRQTACHQDWLTEFKTVPPGQAIQGRGEDFSNQAARDLIRGRIAKLDELERRSGLTQGEREERNALAIRQFLI